jgi:uncharacterized membrane protein YidH (DUF202 family)
MSDNDHKLLVLNTYIRNENLFSSWIRNTIILFSLGVTLSTFSSHKYKDHISITIFLMGLIIGLISLYNYHLTIYNIQNEKYNIPIEYIHNNYSILFILIILGIFFIIQLLKYKKKYISNII